MIQIEVDHSVFYQHSNDGRCIYLLVDVDDIVIICRDQEGIS